MTALLVATVGHGSTALWYLTRATGLVSLILLSATVVLGTVASVGWTTDRWPRFLSQSVHRNLSLFCLALIGIHVVSTVGDGYVPIGLADAVHPLPVPLPPDLGGTRSPGVRHAPRRRHHQRAPPAHRGGRLAWRPLAGLRLLAHCRRPRARARAPTPAFPGRCSCSSCAPARSPPRWPGAWPSGGRARSRWRLGGAVAGAAVLLVITAFAAAGPAPARLVPPGRDLLGAPRPAVGLRRRVVLRGHRRTTNPPTLRAGLGASGIPTAPFQTSVSGTVATSPPDANGESEVTLTMRLADTSAPLQVRIIGPAVNGGVAMRRSAVSFGPLTGQVTALDGSNIGAVVNGPTGSLNLTMNLSLDPSAGTLTGQVSGSAAQ